MSSLQKQYEELQRRQSLAEENKMTSESQSETAFQNKDANGESCINEIASGTDLQQENHVAENTEDVNLTVSAGKKTAEDSGNSEINVHHTEYREMCEHGAEGNADFSEIKSKPDCNIEQPEKAENVEAESKQKTAFRHGLRFSYGIRLIAALYLFYVVFKMYQTRDLNTGTNKLISYGFMIFFALVGLHLLINSLRGTKKLNDEMRRKK